MSCMHISKIKTLGFETGLDLRCFSVNIRLEFPYILGFILQIVTFNASLYILTDFRAFLKTCTRSFCCYENEHIVLKMCQLINYFQINIFII